MSLKSLTIKNNTGSAVTIADTGTVIGASSQDTFTELLTIRKLLQSQDLYDLSTDSTPTLTLNDGTSDIAKAAVPDFIQWFDTGRSSNMVNVDPAGTMDYLTIEEALGGILEMRGATIGLRGGQTHDVDSVLDVRGVTFAAIGEGRPVIRAQTGGQLEVGGTMFRGVEIEAPSTTGGFSGTFFLDVIEGGNEYVGVNFNPESGKAIFGCDSPVAFTTNIMRFCGQSGSGVMVDSGSSFTSPFWICVGENFAGVMEFDADDVYMDDAARADTTTGTLIGIPEGQLYVAPGERIQVAVDSVGSISGGGTVFLLPGVHDITTSINITDDDVTLAGIGDPVVKATSATWVGGTTNNDAVINVGATNGTAPNDQVAIRDIRIECEPNIHGIQVNGGNQNTVSGCEVFSTALKSSLRVGILFTDGASAAGRQFRAEGNLVSSASSSIRWVDGIHMDGNNTFSTYGYGNGIYDSIIFGNIVEYAGETCYVFVDVNDSSIFTNRATDVCFNAGAIGLAIIGGTRCVITVNSISGNNAAGASAAIWLRDCSYAICEQNTIDGNATTFPIGIHVANNADGTIVGGNHLDNCTTGTQVDANCDNTIVRPSTFVNVTTNYVDLNASTKYIGTHRKGTGSPNGVVTGTFGDTYVDTNNNVCYICISYPQGTSWRITAGGWIGQQAYYVGKHGNDSNTGLSMQDAKLTFGSAITAAAAQTPASNNRFSIICLDDGIYSESLTGAQYVDIYAPNATLVGNQTVTDEMKWEFFEYQAASGTCILKSAGAGIGWVNSTRMILAGAANGAICTSGGLCVCIEYIQLVNGFGAGSTSTTDVGVKFGQINITGSGTAIGSSALGTADLCVQGLCIQDNGSGTAIATLGASGTVNVDVNIINCNTAYNIGAGTTLNMHVREITGTETVAATGVANVTYAGTDIPRGTSFPSQPVDGRFWYRTDDDHLYRYDNGRGKWLGEMDWDGGGRSGTQGANSYFRRFNGMVMSATLGTLIPYDVTITGITWAKGDANSGTIEVRRNGVLVVGVATGAATNGSDLTLNSNFTSGGIFSLYWNSANSTTNVQIKVYYRRLQT